MKPSLSAGRSSRPGLGRRSVGLLWGASRSLRRSSGGGTLLVVLCAFWVLLGGCATSPLDRGLTGPFHKLGNFYLINQKLPDDVRRVAMLPLTSSQKDAAAAAGREMLQPILYGELTKSRLFEILSVPGERLAQWTGRPAWNQDEELPADFLVKVREETGCDAILFNQLTFYRPYPPLAIGWRLLLVKADGQVIWSLDEVFDAGEPSVSNSARRHALEAERNNAEFTQQSATGYGSVFSSRITGWEWLNSPRFFAKYTANAAVATLIVK